MDVYTAEEVPLLTALPIIRRLLLAGFDRERFPFTRTQIYIFAILSYKGSLTMSELAGYISSSREQATRAMAPLVDAGFAERYTDPENRTHIHVRLTPLGREELRAMRGSIRSNLNDRLAESLTGAELAELQETTQKLIALLGKVV